jgi:hypothetical protein
MIHLSAVLVQIKPPDAVLGIVLEHIVLIVDEKSSHCGNAEYVSDELPTRHIAKDACKGTFGNHR